MDELNELLAQDNIEEHLSTGELIRAYEDENLGEPWRKRVEKELIRRHQEETYV